LNGANGDNRCGKRFPTLSVFRVVFVMPNLGQTICRASKSTDAGMILSLQPSHPAFAWRMASYLAFADDRGYMTLKFLIG
jgi:hypothetical protein